MVLALDIEVVWIEEIIEEVSNNKEEEAEYQLYLIYFWEQHPIMMMIVMLIMIIVLCCTYTMRNGVDHCYEYYAIVRSMNIPNVDPHSSWPI